MKFELKPVDSLPEYLNVYCGFTSNNHDHLPIIWRNTYRSSYSGWADWGKKYGMVNFYHIYHVFIETNNIKHFVEDFLRIYYHEFIHLFFKFRLGKVYFKGKMRFMNHHEKIIDLLAVMLYMIEINHSNNNWGFEIFENELVEVVLK